MRLIATDVAWSACLCVCPSVGHNFDPFKTDEPIKVPFGVFPVDKKSNVLREDRIPRERGNLGAYCKL